VPRQQHLQSAVWFENGQVVRADIEKERGPNFFDVRRLDDPVLNAQQLLRERLLGQLCDYSRAVSFTNKGE
jgi:hypothetical protein